ncbi:MAG TPA: thiamine-phosphate kinase [Rhodanobacteraceae bacterium]|nr:thiamine-phosphate kinase [Rhodanobacteraceae bacterium]
MEFDLIDAIRARTNIARDDVALGIGDDAALTRVAPGCQLVACVDTLVTGVHFPHGTAPEHIGWKSLAVNLSDLAAMGAAPAWALLALTLPDADAGFVESFAAGFAALASVHDVALIGGDTTQGPLSITVTALGTVPNGEALTRAGARAGDAVFVTGTLGDAAGALRLPRDPGKGAAHAEILFAHLNRPQPRIAAGLALRGIANACVDVSDGLLADLGHVCTASGVGAELEVEALPLSSDLTAAFDPATCRELALAGGDDYELCFTVPTDRASDVAAVLAHAGCDATRIGRIVAGSGVRVLDAHGNEVAMQQAGWEHFSK